MPGVKMLQYEKQNGQLGFMHISTVYDVYSLLDNISRNTELTSRLYMYVPSARLQPGVPGKGCGHGQVGGKRVKLAFYGRGAVMEKRVGRGQIGFLWKGCRCGAG